MKRTMKVVIPLLAVATLGLSPGSLEAQTQQAPPAPRGAQAARPQRQVVVHLTKDAGDLHAVAMSLDLAQALQEGGARVTLFLDLEGVRLADTRVPNQLGWGMGKQTIADRYNRFVKAGGSVLLCPHCAENAGLTTANLRQGARLPTPRQLAETILQADQVIDY
ncbi:DsrE family protein [Polyangium spumosum]|uniref:Signal peptide-domain containing protein n=1 Tax=Polyangium spumosum TaxID=889282 RepID=A0A6N7PEF4_9BACT|nr:DsrE family protein [Polyangium spumosum]MRG90443.1 signal peptide-domain containing protein [Polyangium spumosum]